MPRKGENIYKRKDGRWEARVIYGYENGKAIYRSIYAKTYTQVRQMRQNALLSIENQKTTSVKKNVTFEELSTDWLCSIQHTVKESTYTRYYRIVNVYLNPLFKKMQMSRITEEQLQELPDRLLRNGGKNNGELSAKTVTDILCVLKSILKYGKEIRYACPDYSVIKCPKRQNKLIDIIQTPERHILEQVLLEQDDLDSIGVLFALFTGVRIGELCGIRWEDIDLSNGTVMICRTIERIDNLEDNALARTKIIASTPKTDGAFRMIPIPDFL